MSGLDEISMTRRQQKEVDRLLRDVSTVCPPRLSGIDSMNRPVVSGGRKTVAITSKGKQVMPTWPMKEYY